MGMENETKNFLVRIAQSISLVLLWMLLNVTFGIYFKFGLFEEHPTMKNYIYYFLGIVSFIFLLRYLKGKWKL